MFPKDYIQESINTKSKILNDDKILNTVNDISNAVFEVYKNGKKVLLAGNGGSAADCQHIAGELVAKFYFERAGISAFALTVNPAVLTAVGNDYGFETSFQRQVSACGEKGDIFWAISTSGNSENIILALTEANKKGLITVGFTGETYSKMDDLCKYLIKVPSSDTPKIQESQIMLGHIICALVEERLLEYSSFSQLESVEKSK